MDEKRVATALEILAASESSQDFEARRIVELARVLMLGEFQTRANFLEQVERGKQRGLPTNAIEAWQRCADASIVLPIERAIQVIEMVRGWDVGVTKRNRVFTVTFVLRLFARDDKHHETITKVVVATDEDDALAKARAVLPALMDILMYAAYVDDKSAVAVFEISESLEISVRRVAEALAQNEHGWRRLSDKIVSER